MDYYILPSATDGPRQLSLKSGPDPTPGVGEVLVHIEACSLNYRDLLVQSGKSGSGGDEPVVPLSDGAGIIAAVGDGVEAWKIGDRVALTFFRDWEEGRFEMRYHKAARGGSCDGVLSQLVVAPAHSLVAVPGHLTTTEAAALPCAAVTAWHSLMERSRPLEKGHTVLCLGTGGVSIFALQIAKAAGARVIVTSSSDDKLATARELGADDTINYRSTPEWDRTVYGLTGKLGVDHVIEVGGPGTIEKSMNSVAAGGSIALIGVLTGFAPPQTSLFPLVTRNVDLSGIYVGNRSMFERMNSFLEKHHIHPVIDRTFSFDAAPEAYTFLEQGSHLGKVLVKV